MKRVAKNIAVRPRYRDGGTLRFWSPELRRAMMKVRPEYFRWRIERQERYGVAIPKGDAASLDRVLLKELFGRVYATQRDARMQPITCR